MSLIGKQLIIKQGRIQISVAQAKEGGTSKKSIGGLLEMKVRAKVSDFDILPTYWDCNVPPALTRIEDDPLVKLSLNSKLIQC